MSAWIIHFEFCLTTVPQSLPKRVLNEVRSSASSFNLQYPTFPSGHPVAAYVLSLAFPLLLSFKLSFNKVLWMVDLTQNVTYSRSLSPLSLTLRQHFISYMIGPSNLLHLSSTRHFKSYGVFLAYFPKCPSFSSIQFFFDRGHPLCLLWNYKYIYIYTY